MKQIIRGLFLALLCAGAASAETTAPSMDPIAVGPKIYKSLLDNPKVRVMEVTFPPGAKIGLHSHPDHVGYVLNGGTLKITGADGKSQVHKLKQGETIWLDQQTHSAMNPGDTTLKVLIVEVKPPAAP